MTGRIILASFLLAASLAALACNQDLRAKIDDEAPGERWFYDDFAGAQARAEATKKPLFVIFRCVP